MLTAYLLDPTIPGSPDHSSLSRHLTLSRGRELTLSCDGSPTALSLLEEALMEGASQVVGSPSDSAYGDLTRILQDANRALESAPGDVRTNGFVAISEGMTVHFAIVGTMYVYALKDGEVVRASDTDLLDTRFASISSGELTSGELLMASPGDILQHLTADDIAELGRSDRITDEKYFRDLIDRESSHAGHHIAILTAALDVTAQDSVNSNHFQRLQEVVKEQVIAFSQRESVQAYVSLARSYIAQNERAVRGTLFFSGVALSVVLLYLVIGAIFSTSSTSTRTEEAKTKLIQAQNLVSEAGRDIANRDVFMAKLEQAESLVFEVRSEELFQSDVAKIASTIAILKKQLNGVETIDTKGKELITFESGFHPIAIATLSRQLYFIGSGSILGPYIEGMRTTATAYPAGEAVIEGDVLDDSSVLLRTDTSKILKFSRGAFTTMRNSQSEIWPSAQSMKTFNNAVYLLSSDGRSILRWRPSVGGFGASQSLIASDMMSGSLIDFSLDGGVYMLRDDLAIEKAFTTPTLTKRGIVINKLPDDYRRDTLSRVELVARDGLSYLYLLLDGSVWILQADTRAYKEVKSLTYVGRIELSSGPITAMLIERDGSIVVATDSMATRVLFEVADGALRIR